MHSQIEDKIITDYEEAMLLSQMWKDQGLEVVFTNGCFDLIHRGHLEYLSEASALGDKLIVGLNSDPSIRKIKGKKRPLVIEEDRALLLASISYVDAVVIFEEETPLLLIKKIRPDILVKGGDYKEKDIIGGNHVVENGGEVKVLSYTKGHSTTLLIEKIKAL